MMGFHLLGPLTQKIAFAASMLSVVSLLYVLVILAKPNFKVFDIHDKFCQHKAIHDPLELVDTKCLTCRNHIRSSIGR